MESGLSAIGSTTPTVPPVTGRYCIRCGYALDGLSPTGSCPECGTAVELSLREPTLETADPAFRDKAHAGISLVLNALLLLVASVVLGFALGAIEAIDGLWVLILLGLAQLISAFMSFFGYWKYTAPDPDQMMRESTESARKAIRISVAVQVLSSLITLTLAFVERGILDFALLILVVRLISWIAWIVQFVSVMRYTRWLGSRVPDDCIVSRSSRYMWLLPVIAILGAPVFWLGPLIAWIMYWLLLNRLRKHFKSIKLGLGPADLPGRRA